MMQYTIKRLAAWSAFVAALLMIPLVAMRFTGGVEWTPFDFALAAALLFSAGLVYVLATGNSRKLRHKAAVGVAVAAVTFYIWAELAVGIFTDWGS